MVAELDLGRFDSFKYLLASVYIVDINDGTIEASVSTSMLDITSFVTFR